MPVTKTLTVGGNTYDFAYKTSDLTNDSGFVDAAGAAAAAPVQSVNGQTGDVVTPTEQDIADAIIQVLPVDSASGAVASFPDGYPAPVEALSCAITPVQDLHGQTSPYPAGGGKNKADYPSLILAGAVEQTDGSLYASTASALANAVIFQNDGTAGQFAITYTYKNPGTSRGLYPVIHYTDGTEESAPVNVGSETYITVTKITLYSKTVDYIYFKYGSNVATWFFVQVESGNTASAWTPYANICPITGWSEAVVTRTGSNIFDFSQFATAYPSICSYSDGVLSVTADGALWSTGIPFTDPAPNSAKFLTVEIKNGTATNVRPRIVYKSGTVVETAGSGTSSDWVKLEQTISSGELESIRFNWSGAGTFQVRAYAINLPSTVTTYAPYTAQTVTIDLSGTRYGGTLDVLTGVLTVTHASIDLSTLTWSYLTSPGLRFYATISDVKQITGTETANAWCSQYAVGAWNTIAPDNTKDNMFATTSTYITVRDTRYTDAATFKTAMSGVQLVYELATPLSVQLTPAELETILGQNNVWANCGDVAVSYRADIQRYIQKLMS